MIQSSSEYFNKNFLSFFVFNKKTLLLCFLLGCISSTIFAPLFFLPALLCFSLLTLFVQRSQTAKEAFYFGFCFGIGHFLAGLYWIAIASTMYSTIPSLILLSLTIPPILLALPIAITCVLSWYMRFSNNFTLFLSVTWVLLEWIRSWIFTGFPWNLLGYCLSFSPLLIQTASIWGTYGLSLLVIYIFSGLSNIYQPQKIKQHLYCCSFLIVFILSFGGYKLHNYPTKFRDIQLRIIQPSILPFYQSISIKKHIHAHIDLSEKEIYDKNKPDLIIWPEGSFPLAYNDKIIEQITSKILTKHNSYLIFGGVFEKSSPEYQIYNAAHVVDKNGVLHFSYHKKHLVPFGEYVPFKKYLFPSLQNFIDEVIESYTPGNTEIKIELPDLSLKIRPLICYEAIFPEEVLTKSQEVDFILNLTNDVWFGNSSGPYHHLYISLMRSVESGIPIIRAANNGVSAIISHNGEILSRTNLNQVTYLDSKLPNKLDFNTIYSNLSYIAYLILIILIYMLQVITRYTFRQ